MELEDHALNIDHRMAHTGAAQSSPLMGNFLMRVCDAMLVTYPAPHPVAHRQTDRQGNRLRSMAKCCLFPLNQCSEYNRSGFSDTHPFFSLSRYGVHSFIWPCLFVSLIEMKQKGTDPSSQSQPFIFLFAKIFTNYNIHYKANHSYGKGPLKTSKILKVLIDRRSLDSRLHKDHRTTICHLLNGHSKWSRW